MGIILIFGLDLIFQEFTFSVNIIKLCKFKSIF